MVIKVNEEMKKRKKDILKVVLIEDGKYEFEV
jgi:hypothetical protein